MTRPASGAKPPLSSARVSALAKATDFRWSRNTADIRLRRNIGRDGRMWRAIPSPLSLNAKGKCAQTTPRETMRERL
jgi:hypothetical protein